MEINQAVKQKTADAILAAIENEDMLLKEVADIFGFSQTYLCYLKRDNYFDKVPVKAWEKMTAWRHSGRPLRYYTMHPFTLTKAEDSPDVAMAVAEPMIKAKPGVLEERKKIKKERKKYTYKIKEKQMPMEYEAEPTESVDSGSPSVKILLDGTPITKKITFEIYITIK